MLASTEKITKLNTCLSEREKESAECVMEVLAFLQELLEIEKVWTISSTDTGEEIELHEIARVRGILDGLIFNKEWIMIPHEGQLSMDELHKNATRFLFIFAY